MNLTIIIPTRNRFEEIKNILKYYKNNIFTGKIFIIDSSSLKIFNQTKNLLKKFKTKNVKHFRFIGRPFECTKFFSSKIKTKYVCWSGDDDFYIVEGLKKSIKILDKKKHIDAINGLSLVAKIDYSKKIQIKSWSIYENFNCSNPKPIDRLIKILNNYRVPIFSVFRSNIFIKIMSLVPGKSNRDLCPTRIIHDEFLESLLIVYFNRIYNFKFPFLIRGFPDKKYARFSSTNLIKNQAYNLKQKKSFLFLKKTILKLIKKKTDKELFSYQFDNFVKNIKIKKSKNLYLKVIKMQFKKQYTKMITKNFNSFFSLSFNEKKN